MCKNSSCFHSCCYKIVKHLAFLFVHVESRLRSRQVGKVQVFEFSRFQLYYNECGERGRVCSKPAKIWQIVTFPIKKRINTELLIDGKHELYIHERRIKNSRLDFLGRVVETSVQMSKRGNTQNASLFEIRNYIAVMNEN